MQSQDYNEILVKKLIVENLIVNGLIEEIMKAKDDGSDNKFFKVASDVIKEMGSLAINLVREKINELKYKRMAIDDIALDNLIFVFSFCSDEKL